MKLNPVPQVNHKHSAKGLHNFISVQMTTLHTVQKLTKPIFGRPRISVVFTIRKRMPCIREQRYLTRKQKTR